MEQRMITIYCLIEEFLKGVMEKEEHKLSEISDSEVLFLGYLAVNDFNGNYSKAHYYGMGMKLVNEVEYSRFTRRIIQLEEEIEQLFVFLSDLFIKLNGLQIYSVDSFPVELCQIQREKRSKLWRDISLKGYNASKKKYFYGFKVHMVVTTNQEPVSYYISEGSMHDTTASYKFLPNLPKNSIVIGDKGYISGKLESFLAKFGIELSALKRKNMQQDPAHKVKRKIRKGVETAFSVITAKFGKVIRATSIRGFLVKLKLFLLAYSIDRFFKLSVAHQQLAFN
ncbi:MAG: Transposase, IS4 family [uncultured Sulfurovum sp.]|uniref:Transposase, IS4 family n=1 Tax=uncultured Sulfurovum sp. TaxID=269237 RepID=A0A6S6SAT9_9BACT|nr:MAG: Transposase, IS4 family [uncultured Sulfurovum sp.]